MQDCGCPEGILPHEHIQIGEERHEYFFFSEEAIIEALKRALPIEKNSRKQLGKLLQRQSGRNCPKKCRALTRLPWS